MAKKRSIPKKMFLFFMVALIGSFMIIPLYILVKVSFSDPSEVLTAHPTLLPHSFTFQHWKNVLESGNLWAPLSKSLIVSTATTILAVAIVAPASYAISRMHKSVKYIFIMTLFFTRMFPAVGIALPISIQFIKWDLIDTNIGLILANLISQLPFMAWILVSTFEAIPKSLEEAAAVDGASRLRTLLTIIFPVASQGIAVAAMYVWLNSWNEFTYALYLSLSTKTLPLGVYYYVERGGFFQQAAYSTILTIPVIIITFFLQKYLKSGNLSGAEKG